MRRRGTPLLVVAIATGCGSRTALLDDEFVPAADAGDADAGQDARSDAAIVRDADVADGPPCTRDRDCDDGVPCTVDACDPTVRRCRNDGQNGICQDGRFCNGAERCDTKRGCVAGTPPTCSDGIACTDDACDEAAAACVHHPDDRKCPPPELCDPVAGCANFAYACSPSELYEVTLPAGTLRAIGTTAAPLYDIALHPNGILYGTDGSTALYAVDRATAALSPAGTLNQAGFNGMDVAPNGDLYASGGSSVWKIDLTAGTGTLAATFPFNLTSSGDMAFVSGVAFATGRGGGVSDDLVEFDLLAGTSNIVGAIGFSCVYGLAEFGALLYGFTCDGTILRIDTTSGVGTELAHPEVTFYGASAR